VVPISKTVSTPVEIIPIQAKETTQPTPIIPAIAPVITPVADNTIEKSQSKPKVKKVYTKPVIHAPVKVEVVEVVTVKQRSRANSIFKPSPRLSKDDVEIETKLGEKEIDIAGDIDVKEDVLEVKVEEVQDEIIALEDDLIEIEDDPVIAIDTYPTR